MKIPFAKILKWIGTTLFSAALQEGASRILRPRSTDGGSVAPPVLAGRSVDEVIHDLESNASWKAAADQMTATVRNLDRGAEDA